MTAPSSRWLALLFLLLLAVCAGVVVGHRRTPAGRSGEGDLTASLDPELVRRFTALQAREEQANSTVWTKEILAEDCGRVVENLWDALNASSNRFAVLDAIDVGELILPRYAPPMQLAHGIERRESVGAGEAWSSLHWRRFLAGIRAAGWEIDQVEFRHNQFDTDAAGRPQGSRFWISAHLLKRAPPERAVLEGDLAVRWAPRPADGGPPAAIAGIDASRLTLSTRRGERPFRPVLTETIAPPEKSFFIDPLILHDLDGDGADEIILAARNLVYWRREGGRYEAAPLCRESPGLIFTALVADFDGDGVADFLCARFDGLYLFHGSPGGAFDGPGHRVWAAEPHLKYPQALSCGDIDGDGDLDVFLGQYKVPYTRGQMPAPYDNANDGDPSYLLLNDGLGHFTDATAAAGLDSKRRRRTYSASFVDLDGDGDLDLVVTSDFAGTDLYANDGRGHFRDVTREWIAEPRAFGMAHALADFNADGRLDLLVIGMNSPVADRLGHLGLARPGAEDELARRRAMTFGNRLYLGGPGPVFQTTALNESIARSGWAWGCSAFDFDNDGYPDVYVANGHETRETVRDYESEFWLHDIYIGTSTNDLAAAAYFSAQYGRTRARGWSYGGYEKNRLYLNQRAGSFLEAGYLMGVALEEDSRGVVADDLDGDGRVDLLLTTFEAWPVTRQTLRVFRNELTDGGNWIGFRFPDRAGGPSPVGARLTLHYAGGAAVRQIVTGDSYRAQHAAIVHFGLGEARQVDSAEVRWPDGRSVALRRPEVNRYHLVQ